MKNATAIELKSEEEILNVQSNNELDVTITNIFDKPPFDTTPITKMKCCNIQAKFERKAYRRKIPKNLSVRKNGKISQNSSTVGYHYSESQPVS